MASLSPSHLHRCFRWATLTLGALSLLIVSYAFQHIDDGQQWAGRLLPQHLQRQQEWTTFTATDLEEGQSLQPHTNTIIHIPDTVTRITRKVLFGWTGKDIRYWGYCFPEDYDRERAVRRSGFPGTIFLSEKERDVRNAATAMKRRSAFSVYDDLNETYLNEEAPSRGIIRHQQEIFTGGQACYIMSEGALPIGIDADNDTSNSAVEKEHGSDPANPDTDGDGVTDGLEAFRLGTFATKRDSDGDGLIDGIEDSNRNGRFDTGETNAMIWDTDRDGLCDGLCKVRLGKEVRGEDKNLNGKVDDEELDPRKEDSDGNGVLDEQEFLNCQLANGADC